MSRIFTLPIPFGDRTYTALVNFKQGANNLSLSVRYLDDEAEAIVPGRCIVFSLATGLESPTHLDGLRARSFVQTTSDIIARYLSKEALA